MKKIFLLLFATIFVLSASAQRIGFGPKVGMNVAMLTDRGLDPRFNYNAGAFIEYDISVPWSLELSAMYSRQGAVVKDVQISLLDTGDVTFKMDYINVPLVAKYYPWMGLNIFFGPQFSYRLNADLKYEGLTQIDIKDETEDFDFGATFGVGYTWKCGMMVMAQYNIGFRDAFKESIDENVYNSVVQISVGWRF